MAQDITYDFGTQTAYTITINSVADGSGATGTAVDLGATGPVFFNMTALFDGNSASNTAYVDIYIQWSDDNTDFSDSSNDEYVGSVLMLGTTAVKKVFQVENKGRYHQVRVQNESGDSMLSSGNTLEYSEVAVDQA